MTHVKQSFFIALLACLLWAGLILTPWYTISPRLNIEWLHAKQECQPVGKSWDCWKPEKKNFFLSDGGAVSWAQMTSAYLHHKTDGFAKWDPYTGSGYPIFLDGHNRSTSLWSWWVKLFPSDQGRDWMVFCRAFLMVFGVVLFLMMCGVGKFLSTTTGFLVTMAPLATEYLDHVFLDVDLMLPWILVMLKAGQNAVESKLRQDFKIFYFLCVLLGLWIGLQVFIEAQAAFGICVLVAFVSFATQFKKHAILGLIAFSFFYLLAALPQIFTYLSHFDYLLSNRLPGTCFSSLGAYDLLAGFRNIFLSSFSGYYKNSNVLNLFSFLGVLPILYLAKGKNKNYLIYFGIFFIVLLAGLPRIICQFKGLNGIHFWRHFIIYEQILFIIFCSLGIHEILLKLKAKKISRLKTNIILFTLLLFCQVTFIRKNVLNIEVALGEFAKEFEYEFQEIPKSSVFHHVKNLSQTEDRRHFSPDERLYPNWSSSLKIMDLRVLYAFYPKWTFELYYNINPFWAEQTTQVPDRFVKLSPYSNLSNAEVIKNLLLARVSLLTFSKEKMWLPQDGFYSQKSCRLIASDQLNQSWLCPEIDGVSFFPKHVELNLNEYEILTKLKNSSIDEIKDSTWIKVNSIGDYNAIGAQGKIIGFTRTADTLIYNLDIYQEGFFVITDSWFPGWRASVNDQEIDIFQANYAYKAVWLTTGKQNLKLDFQK